MNVNDFAIHILRSEALSDKLWVPPPLVVSDTLKPDDMPTRPARSSGLRPSKDGHRKIKKSIITGAHLADIDERIQLLHAFANHELLALELFAWVLLKFPDAPPSFKKGISGIMLDEQRHCTLYCQRLEELGSHFGAFPVNDFMWRTISQANTLSQFTAAMSLTFEQANLDFAAHYAKIFAAAGDDATAAILQLVFDEEIQHVKHGVHWFEKWRPDGDDLFTYHEASLQHPLTLARAQGSNFQGEARSKAGFPSSYIDRLRTHAASKGRPPRVFFFNPCYELENVTETNSFSPTQTVRDLEHDLSSLLMFIAHKDDVVMVHRRPSEAFLLGLAKSGFSSCDFIEYSGASVDPKTVSQRHLRLSKLEPWGWSPRSRHALSGLIALLPTKEQQRLTSMNETLGLDRRPRWLGKVYAHHLRMALPWPKDPLSQEISIVYSEAELLNTLTHIATKTVGPVRWVAKAPLGASGNQHLRFMRGEPLSDNARGWMRNTLSSQGALIFEPWVEKFADFSVVGHVDANGYVQIWGITRFLTDEKGHYTGHQFSHPLANLEANVVREVHQSMKDGSGHRSMMERLTATANHVAAALTGEGYSGPFGIDAFLYQGKPWHGDDLICMQPLVEVNTRWTMGHIASQLQKQLSAQGSGVWHHMMAPALKATGYENFSAFAESMRGVHGARFIPTNDPIHAKQCLSFVLLDPTKPR